MLALLQRAYILAVKQIAAACRIIQQAIGSLFKYAIRLQKYIFLFDYNSIVLFIYR